jgi:hypothetical protein
MFYKRSLLFVGVLCLAAAACGRIYGPVNEVKAFKAAEDEVLDQWTKTLAEKPNDAGVEEARKIFDAKKADLAAKKQAIDDAPRGINSDWLTLHMDLNLRTFKTLDELTAQFCVKSYESCDKFKALVKDFEKTVKRY